MRVNHVKISIKSGYHIVPSPSTPLICPIGVYATRNSDVYLHGRFEMSYNKAYRNGINGLVVHKTDRVRVFGNVLWDNGKVSKSKPESRQPYAGLTVTGSKYVKVNRC